MQDSFHFKQLVVMYMAFELRFRGKMLVNKGAGHARVTLTNGMVLEIHSGRLKLHDRVGIRPIQERRRPDVQSEKGFVTPLGGLRNRLQRALRKQVGEKQQRIHDTAPRFQHPRPKLGGMKPNPPRLGSRGTQYGPTTVRRRLPEPEPIPLEVPPATIELSDTYSVFVQPNGIIDGYPYLQVGKKLLLKAQFPHTGDTIPAGTIKSISLIK